MSLLYESLSLVHNDSLILSGCESYDFRHFINQCSAIIIMIIIIILLFIMFGLRFVI